MEYAWALITVSSPGGRLSDPMSGASDRAAACNAFGPFFATPRASPDTPSASLWNLSLKRSTRSVCSISKSCFSVVFRIVGFCLDVKPFTAAINPIRVTLEKIEGGQSICHEDQVAKSGAANHASAKRRGRRKLHGGEFRIDPMARTRETVA